MAQKQEQFLHSSDTFQTALLQHITITVKITFCTVYVP